ncbi:MAG: glycine C-acetyltransferase [Candidatus Latescibacteria bacterium]|nr:glycine C-acetyltransferase [Candidatus Latescibacterota bacterium]NIO28346.1 glycine C-acetyltransferase [Candidatus Latescibacterota bacterium]NIO55894.1 glycine C-acetyltransferase [Candidatus Latescibacterota bacterium]NIT01859.1 glycine C-acetyltransferase [Candidatus Latescibacterota bacterium]
MYGELKEKLTGEISSIREAGLYKDERIILSPQAAEIKIKSGEVINFCANNYLGLSSHPKIIEAAHRGLDDWGYGMSSVRFICGTQDIHKKLEAKISEFLGTEDTILYSSCFDANGGLFEAILGEGDVVISDELNHASIIDGIRLCKADRKRFRNSDMQHLEEILKECTAYRTRMIATDGVFSMDGFVAKLDEICGLAERYDALVMVDDSHATGFVGPAGRGTPEYHDVIDKVDVITSTLGKALGGASGGFTSGRSEIVEFLRQRSRPYLFSNTLTPSIVYAAMTAIDLLAETTELRDKLKENTLYFRRQLTEAGFDIKEGTHPIVPIMLGDAKLAHDMAHDLLEDGIYVIGFSYPVVPKGQARIRVQISAAHEKEHLDKAIEAFKRIGEKYGIAG